MSGAGIDIDAFHPWGDLSWTENASCRGAMHKGPDWWFPEREMADVYYSLAREVCAKCPVKQACADYAIEARIPHGMWGGLTPEDRGMTRRTTRRSVTRAKQKQPPQGPPLAGHGTATNYGRGCRCEHCRWAEHERYIAMKARRSGSNGIGLQFRDDVLQPSVEQREAGPGAAVTAAEALEPRPLGGQDS